MAKQKVYASIMRIFGKNGQMLSALGCNPTKIQKQTYNKWQEL